MWMNVSAICTHVAAVRIASTMSARFSVWSNVLMDSAGLLAVCHVKVYGMEWELVVRT